MVHLSQVVAGVTASWKFLSNSLCLLSHPVVQYLMAVLRG
jgi:hypothetical protein